MVKAKVVKNPFKKPKIISRKGNKVTKPTKLTPAKAKSDGPKRRSKNFNKKPKIISRKGNKVTKPTKLTPAKAKSDGPKRRSKNFNKKVLKEERGVVFLSHIPHGFFEEQMEKYFSQFGHVTRVNLPRNKLGNSKGYAFIEFRHADVAKIAAETMDNYLMMNRLLKAQYIPPEQQKPWIFDRAYEDKLNHTTRKEKLELNLRRNRTLKNRKLSVESEAKLAARMLRKAKAMHTRMQQLGVDYDFEVNKESVDAVFEKRKELQIKKNNIIQQSLCKNIDKLQKRELTEDNKTPEVLQSKKKMKLATKQQLSEKKELTTTDQSINVKQTPTMKKKLLVQPSPAENKKQAAESSGIAKQTLNVKRKRTHKQSNPNKSAVNISMFSNKNSNEVISPKNKKSLKNLSTSLPIKNTKKKDKSKNLNITPSPNKASANKSPVNMSVFSVKNSNEEILPKNKKSVSKLSTSLPIKNKKKSENLNQSLSVKKKRASNGLLTQNGRPEKTVNKKRQSAAGNLNHALILKATGARPLSQQSTPIKLQKAQNKKKSLNLNEAKSEKASLESPPKQKKTTGPKVIGKKVKPQMNMSNLGK